MSMDFKKLNYTFRCSANALDVLEELVLAINEGTNLNNCIITISENHDVLIVEGQEEPYGKLISDEYGNVVNSNDEYYGYTEKWKRNHKELVEKFRNEFIDYEEE